MFYLLFSDTYTKKRHVKSCYPQKPYQKFSTCSICLICILAKNMPRHMQRKHCKKRFREQIMLPKKREYVVFSGLSVNEMCVKIRKVLLLMRFTFHTFLILSQKSCFKYSVHIHQIYINRVFRIQWNIKNVSAKVLSKCSRIFFCRIQRYSSFFFIWKIRNFCNDIILFIKNEFLSLIKYIFQSFI